MRTLLISVFDSNMVRNILRTDVLKTLAATPSIDRIVLLVHPTKLEEYSAEFSSEKIILDTYPSNLPSKLELVSWFLVRHAIHTKNVRAKINELYYTAGGNQLMRLIKFLAALTVFYATKITFIGSIVRAFAYAVHEPNGFRPIMERFAPDLVFMPTIFATNDIRLLKYCVQNQTPNIGMIKSWDNLIGKDPLLIWPDTLIVHNRIVEELLENMHRYPKERICITGIPQMDAYADPSFPLTREDLFGRLGLDLNKKLITYAAVGKLISYHEPEVIAFLADLVNSGTFSEPVQLLVRLHPAYPSDEALLQDLPSVTIVRPGKTGAERNPLRFDFEFREDESRELAATLKWSDVLIQSGSTMAIDAACFDTPIISLGFDGYTEDEIQERSARRLLVKDHFRRILDTGGTRAVYSKLELIDAIDSYLAEPSLDAEGRARIVSEQCYLLDGNAGKRIAEHIFKRLAGL